MDPHEFSIFVRRLGLDCCWDDLPMILPDNREILNSNEYAEYMLSAEGVLSRGELRVASPIAQEIDPGAFRPENINKAWRNWRRETGHDLVGLDNGGGSRHIETLRTIFPDISKQVGSFTIHAEQLVHEVLLYSNGTMLIEDGEFLVEPYDIPSQCNEWENDTRKHILFDYKYDLFDLPIGLYDTCPMSYYTMYTSRFRGVCVIDVEESHKRNRLTWRRVADAYTFSA